MSGVDAGGKIVSVLMSYQITSPLALKNQGKANHQPCAVEDNHALPVMGYFTFPYFYSAHFNHLKINFVCKEKKDIVILGINRGINIYI